MCSFLKKKKKTSPGPGRVGRRSVKVIITCTHPFLIQASKVSAGRKDFFPPKQCPTFCFSLHKESELKLETKTKKARNITIKKKKKNRTTNLSGFCHRSQAVKLNPQQRSTSLFSMLTQHSQIRVKIFFYFIFYF